MKFRLIGLICVAAIENDIAMTPEQIVKMGEYLAKRDVRVGAGEIIIEMPAKFNNIEAKTVDEPAIVNPVEELGISKKNQKKLRHATIDDIIKPKPVKKVKAAEQTDLDKRMEDAYLGEHPNIQPAPVEKKPLSPREQQLWDYMKAHPDARMPSICEAMGITNVNYFYLKNQLKKKGWIVSAVENVKEVEL